ncbi:synergin gamma isoform X3 [Silurus meridionalis]|uniref:synergin gamma isoform X3 n=1 Tax=Silurus meridionalis TaxID=175797 RepID=UPI001EEBAB53|nr:synergin gamma isoform X3 [Silurus meridionalis]
MALRPGSGGGGSFMYPVGGGLGPPQGMMPMQQQQQQQGFPMVPVMQPNMQGMMGMNFGPQMPTGPMPMQGGMAMGMQAPGMQFMGQPQFMGMRAAGPQYPADLQKQMAEEHQKRLEQQQRMLEEDRKRRQFEEQKQKLRLLSSVKPKTGEKSRDDALEAIKGNLDGFSRDAKMHPTPSSQSKKPDSSPSHSSVPPHSISPAFAEDDDEFSDFIQGPVEASFSSSSLPLPSFSSIANKSALEAGAGQQPCSSPLPFSPAPSLNTLTVPHHSSVISSSQSTFQGPSLEEKLFSSCDLKADKRAQVNFKPNKALVELAPRAQVSVRFQSSLKARNWAQCSDDLSAAFMVEKTPEPPTASPAPKAAEAHPDQTSSASAGVGVYPQQEMQNLLPAWLYNDTLVPEMFKKVLELTMTPAGIDTAKLYPILMSSGLPREALGQIWASANRTTPGKLTKEELYTVLALIGVAQSGLPSMSLDILSQFPTPPVPNLPAMTMTMPAVLTHQQPIMHPTAPPVMPMTSNSLAQPSNSFIANFPPVQGTKVDDDDFQDFQEAPKAGDDSFTDFQGETGGTFPTVTSSQSSISAMLTPVTGSTSSSTSDKYAVFKHLSVEHPTESTPPVSDLGDKYSVFRELEPASDRKPVGEGFADFKSVGADDGFTDFKTANSTSPLDPPDQAKTFQPSSFQIPFGSSHSLSQSQTHPASLAQPKNPLNMSDLDLFSSIVPPSIADSKATTLSISSSSTVPSLLLPSTGPKPDDFGDFALFGSSSSSSSASEATASAQKGSGGGGAAGQDDFADFLSFGNPGKQPNESSKESDGFADFQSSKFQEKSLVDKMAAFKQTKEDSASVKSLDLPSIGGSSVGKDDSEDALSVQLDMKLSDVAGELKHGASDSSLDLPGLNHQPPATEVDDLKFDPFGNSGISGSTVCDWSDKDDAPCAQGTKAQAFPVSGLPSLAVLHRKETSFGSSENVTHTTLEKVTTFPIEDTGFADFADFSSAPHAPREEEDDDFGDFASTVSEKSDAADTGLEATHPEVLDDFTAFQADKPKFGKSDFLKASAQPKAKSSEEMIKNELATFDLSVQGSHKRSHSLGEKEICSTPSPAPEQQFRDRANTLSEKAALPVIRDKYKDLTGEVEESERYAYEWQRCLESALQVISTANNTLNGISSSGVCTEVIQSAQGMEYLLGVVEVYRVARRVELGIKATAVCSEKLQELLKDISRVWNNLMGFMSLANVSPDESSLDFSSCILRPGIKNAKELACGVCLLNVDSRSKKKEENTFGRLFKKALVKDPGTKLMAFNSETDNFKLTYGGHQYHASCANFWINCVEPKPPGLILPDLL